MQPVGTWRMAVGQGAPESEKQVEALARCGGGREHCPVQEQPRAKAQRPKRRSWLWGASCHAVYLELRIIGQAGGAGRCHAKAWLYSKTGGPVTLGG